jgi:hypothetical protein
MNVFDAHMAFKVLFDKGGSLAYPDFDPEEIDLFLNKAILRVVKSKLTGKSINPLRKDSVEETEKRINDLRLLTEDYRVVPLVRDTNKNKPYGNFIVLPDHFMYLLDETVNIREYDCHGLITNYNDVEVKKTTHDKFSRMMKDPFNKPNLNRVLKLPFGYYTHNVNTQITPNPAIGVEIIDNEYILETPVAVGTFLIGDIITIGTETATIEIITLNKTGSLIVSMTTNRYIDGENIILINRIISVTSEVEEIITTADVQLYKMRYIRYPRLLDYTLYDPNNPNVKVVDYPAGSYNSNFIELTDQVCDEVIDEAVIIALEVIESKRYQSNSYENNKVS